MTRKQKDEKGIVRRLFLFVILLNLLAWAGWFIAQDGTQDALDLGNLIWLLCPFLLTIIFRLFSKDWKDVGLRLKLFGNLKWYLFSVLIFPILVLVVLIAGSLFKVVSFASFDNFAQVFLASAGFIFVKNIFEEFTWRGYLTSKLEQRRANRLTNHFIVGLIWGIWHIPYYMGLLDSASLNAYTTLPKGVFIPLIIISMVVAAIVFGELRLITGSVWPAVLMHTISNLLIMTLLLEHFIEISSYQVLFSPSWEGILMMIMLFFAGIWLRKRRMRPPYIQL